MVRLIVQIVIGAIVWCVMRYFEFTPVASVIVVGVVVFVVMPIGLAVLFPPSLHDIRPLDPNDPLMISAVEQARSTFAKFLEIYPEHRDDSVVRFSFEADQGVKEHLWGDLLEIDDTTAKVFVRTFPVHHDGPFERTMTIDQSLISDWQVEFRDGTLRGGYTNQASFKIKEREDGELHPTLAAQKQRFHDIDW